MQKRKCRMNKSEIEYHDRAVKLRKMTDSQLCEFIETEKAKAFQEGETKARAVIEKEQAGKGVSHYLQEVLSSLSIGKVTQGKLLKIAEEGGYIGME